MDNQTIPLRYLKDNNLTAKYKGAYKYRSFIIAWMISQTGVESRLKKNNFYLHVCLMPIFKCGFRDFDKVRPSHDWLKFAGVVEWSDIT